MEKVYDVDEEDEKIVVGLNRYDLVNLEAKSGEDILRIMGSIS